MTLSRYKYYDVNELRKALGIVYGLIKSSHEDIDPHINNEELAYRVEYLFRLLTNLAALSPGAIKNE